MNIDGELTGSIATRQRRIRNLPILCTILILSLAMAQSVRAQAFDQAGMSSPTLQFHIFDPSGGGNCDECVDTLLIYGHFDQGASDRFAQFSKVRKFGRIVFHSPGGDLGAGLRLGALIRKGGWSTSMELEYSDASGCRNNSRECRPRILVNSAVCASACAYAFMGGKQRKVEPGARIGVHQFRGAQRQVNEAAAQETTVLLARYLDAMDIDRRLLDFASSTKSSEIHFLSSEVAKQYRLDNSSIPLAAWSISATSVGEPYVVLNQLQSTGNMARIAIYKGSRSPLLYVGVFLPIPEYSERHRQLLGERIDTVELLIDERKHILQVISPWRAQHLRDKIAVSIEAEIPPITLSALRTAKKLELHQMVSNANRDMAPSGKLTLDGLRQGVSIIAREYR